MGPRKCSLCGKDRHEMLQCPELPIVKLGTAAAPIVGFRCWKARTANGSVRLTSIYKDAPWNARGPNDAACDLGTQHTAPSLRCSCGLYACYSLREAAYRSIGDEIVFGAVLGWGRVYLHENGWRAQTAQVVCFTSIGLPRVRDLAVAAAAGLPLLPSSSVETYAAEFGVDGAALYRSG
jgi:hypothetical protein